MSTAQALPQPGTPLTPQTRRPTPESLVLYSAVTWNPHRIHYDQQYVRELGHSAPLVHGALVAEWALQWVVERVGPCRVRSVSYRMLAPAYLDRTFEVGGAVCDRQADDGPTDAAEPAGCGTATVPLQVWVRDESGTLVLQGDIDVEVRR